MRFIIADSKNNATFTLPTKLMESIDSNKFIEIFGACEESKTKFKDENGKSYKIVNNQFVLNESTSSKILEAGSTIKSITSFCEKYPKEYICKDGVLFNKTMTILFKYPSDKTVSNKTYIIPDSVTKLYDGSFYDVLSDNLNTIIATPKLIDSLKNIDPDDILDAELYNLIIKDKNNNNKEYNFYADQKKTN